MGEIASGQLMTLQIMERVQERCRECPQAKLGAMALADKVISGEIELEAAAEGYATEISMDCYGGNPHDDMPGMPFECWRGIRTPVTPPHLREDWAQNA